MRSQSPIDSASVYPPRAQHAPSSSRDDDDVGASVGLLQDENATSSADERIQHGLKRVESPEEEEEEAFGQGGMTPLDETLEVIGMGRYQKTLL